MPDTVADLVQRGRALPAANRERWVEQQLESLNEDGAHSLDATCHAEIERRLAEYDRGEVQGVDAEEVFAKAARLAK